MTGARSARLKRKLNRWLWARANYLPRWPAYRYLWTMAVYNMKFGVFDRKRHRFLSDLEALELPGLDLWEERVA